MRAPARSGYPLRLDTAEKTFSAFSVSSLKTLYSEYYKCMPYRAFKIVEESNKIVRKDQKVSLKLAELKNTCLSGCLQCAIQLSLLESFIAILLI